VVAKLGIDANRAAIEILLDKRAEFGGFGGGNEADGPEAVLAGEPPWVLLRIQAKPPNPASLIAIIFSSSDHSFLALG